MTVSFSSSGVLVRDDVLVPVGREGGREGGRREEGGGRITLYNNQPS